MWAKIWWWLKTNLAGQYRTYRPLWWCLIVSLVVGCVGGIISVAVGGITIDAVNYHLIDGNILNMTALDVSAGRFIGQRWLAIMLPIILVLIFACGAAWLRWLVVPLAALHGYWLWLTVWWVFGYYGWSALWLLIFYGCWLLLLTAILLLGWLWVIHLATLWRQKLCPAGSWWGQCVRGLLILSVVCLACGFIEYLVYISALGRIVYKPL